MKQLEASESKFRRLIENIKGHYFFYTLDLNAEISYVSESLTELLGYSTAEFKANFENYLRSLKIF